MFKNSYFIKEIRQLNIESKINVRNSFFFGIFTALFSYLIHLAFLRLKGTVFAQSFPYLVQEDCFSPVYTYVKVFKLFCVLYFLVFYEHISLTEIRTNRWYLLAKMGYDPKFMVTVKTLAQFFPLLLTFIIGFAGTLGTAVLSNYFFAFYYLPALFLAGVVEIAFLCSLSKVLSLINRFKSVFYSRCLILFAQAVLMLLSELTGYRDALSSKSFIAENGMLSPFAATVSIYFLFVLAIIVLFTIESLYNAKSIAMYYDEPLENTDFSLPAGRILARLDHRTGMFYIFRNKGLKIRSKIFDIVFILFLCSVIVFTFALNLFQYYNKAGTLVQIGESVYCMSDTTVQQGGSIQPVVNVNDLLVFKAVDTDNDIDTGNLVLIKSDKGLKVLPFFSQVDKADIIGRLDAVERWLGAAVVLANSMEGRVLFFVLPLLMLLLYKNIRKLLTRKPVPIE